MEENTGRLVFIIAAVAIFAVALVILIRAGMFDNFRSMIYSVVSHSRQAM